MGIFERFSNLFKEKQKTIFILETEKYNEIQTLETKLVNIKDKVKKDEIKKEIAKKKDELKQLNENDPNRLKFRIEELQKEVEKINNLNIESRYLVRYYEAIIHKYVPKNEEKTVDKLQALIDYKSIAIEMFVDLLKGEEFEFEKDYLKVLKKIFSHIKQNFFLLNKKFEVKYWFNSSEILTEKTGDYFDIAILVCSLMHALGDFDAEINFVELDNYDTFAFVKTKFKRTEIIFDIFNFETFEDMLNPKEYLIKNLKINKVLYGFNAFKYRQ